MAVVAIGSLLLIAIAAVAMAWLIVVEEARDHNRAAERLRRYLQTAIEPAPTPDLGRERRS